MIGRHCTNQKVDKSSGEVEKHSIAWLLKHIPNVEVPARLNHSGGSDTTKAS
jgi:hypothetical protein